jgi:hypothetical protein
MTDITLPAVVDKTAQLLQQLSAALNLPREVVASDEEIAHAWRSLPRELQRIPPEQRNELLARLCVAVAVGLFDSAINYAWNAAILQLRARVRAFGLHMVAQVKSGSFEESDLLDLKDAELLDLCLSLNLLTEEAYFFLSDARDIRNHFSAAHPAIGQLDDRELIVFVSRCAKYALTGGANPEGVDTNRFLAAMKAGAFDEDQLALWVGALEKTHEAQRELLIGTLHGLYCDPAATQHARQNALGVIRHFASRLQTRLGSSLVKRHADYLAGGDQQRRKASRQFFENLGLLSLLTDAERHSIIVGLSQRLLSVHNALDNFYNEPPFAERLQEVSSQAEVPASAQEEFVNAVVTCGVGNPYGVSHAAFPHYKAMVENFSPAEIAYMLEMPTKKSVVAERLARYPNCAKRFRVLVNLVNEAIVPTKVQKAYQRWRRDL